MSMSLPLITVGITAYNAEDTISQAIDSALNQTWKNLEIIIVDDCSSDKTIGIIDDFEEKNSLIKTVVSNAKNEGVAYTRNRIIDYSQGEYIAFFDDDDISDPNRIVLQYKKIIEYQSNLKQKEPILCYTARCQKYPDGNDRIEKTTGTGHTDEVPFGPKVAYKILTGCPIKGVFGSMATCSLMAPMNFLNELKGFDENFKRSEDTEFNIRAALKGTHFIGVSEPLVTQKMTKTRDKPISLERQCAIMMLRKHASIVNKVMPLDFCIKWVDLKYYFLQDKKLMFFYHLLKLILQHPVLIATRFVWATPNLGFNLSSKKFYRVKVSD